MEKKIYRALVDYDFAQPAVLCVQLEHKGSVPRKDYPVMLVMKDGTCSGTIGGGNMEFAVIEEARRLFSDGAPARLESFDLTHQTTSAKGSICGGACRVLLEPYTPAVQETYASMNLLGLEDPGLIFVTHVQSGSDIQINRTVLKHGDSVQAFPDKLAKLITLVKKNRRSRTLSDGADFSLVQWIPNTPMLHIFGAGHIGQAVAELAGFIDLDTTIYDERASFATADRFPAAQIRVVESYPALAERLQMTPTDYVLVVTRGHQHDLVMMRRLCQLKPRYIGLVSSRIKWRILAEALAEEGHDSATLASVHAPVGLAIGSETVPEIAVSIIAQIVGVMRSAKVVQAQQDDA